MSLARIGSARSPSTWTTAFSTQPGRRGRCRPGHKPLPRCVARPHGGEFLGQAGQRPL
jgi:hypothetical protein